MLKGCVMSVMFSRQNEATARVLARNGCEVIVPPGQGCCGSLHMHMGYRQAGTDLVKNNLDVFEPDEVDAIISNAAGCGAMMKEYGEKEICVQLIGFKRNEELMNLLILVMMLKQLIQIVSRKHLINI